MSPRFSHVVAGARTLFPSKVKKYPFRSRDWPRFAYPHPSTGTWDASAFGPCERCCCDVHVRVAVGAPVCHFSIPRTEIAEPQGNSLFDRQTFPQRPPQATFSPTTHGTPVPPHPRRHRSLCFVLFVLTAVLTGVKGSLVAVLTNIP